MTAGELDPSAPVTPTEGDEGSWSALLTLGRALHVSPPSLAATLDAILRAAADNVDGADSVGVNLLRGQSFEPQAVLGEAPVELDMLQKRTGTGPCIDASREQRVIRVDDVPNDPRWPEYAELATSLGVSAMLCVPLWVDEQSLGSISLYSRSTAAFGQKQVRIASLLAVHAAVALSEAQRIENLGIALRNRDLIGQAKGILMERHRITADAAFDMLASSSQRGNRKLSSVAEQLASTGILPD